MKKKMAARDEMKTKGHGEYEEIVETEFLKKAPRTACSILPTTSDLRFDQITFQKASKDKKRGIDLRLEKRVRFG